MRMRYALAAGAAVMLTAAAGGYALAAGTYSNVTFSGCLAGGRISGVSVTRTPGCAATATPVQWAGQAVTGSPSPSPTSPSPAPTTPSPSPTSPSPSPTGTSAGCGGTGPSVTCGGYADPAIVMSNGYNTYDETNCWADPGCGFTLAAPDPPGGSAVPWTVTGSETAGNTGVRAYPDEQQLTNNWCGTGWNGCLNPADTPVSGLTSLTSSYAETMPHNAGTDAQAAWDIWLSGTSGPGEVMIWVDNVNRGSGGAVQVGATTVAGQPWTLYQYGGGELIWSLDNPDGSQFAQQPSGTVDLLALLRWLQANGFEGSAAAIGQIDFGWEVCSTGGGPETFTVTSYGITGS